MSILMIIMGLATLLHDAESGCDNWYLDESLSHMRKECKTYLQDQFNKECKKINGKFVSFHVCNIKCQVTTGKHVKPVYIKLKNDLPCGPYGEICKEGICYGPCNVQFFNQVNPRTDEEIDETKTDVNGHLLYI
uniref:Putative ixostatin n=1 Tax=Ixodes ricinus TaxID=34613 RepID=A0A0K8RAX2_IXORI